MSTCGQVPGHGRSDDPRPYPPRPAHHPGDPDPGQRLGRRVRHRRRGDARVRALATASHSIAATFGYADGENIPLELHLGMVERVGGNLEDQLKPLDDAVAAVEAGPDADRGEVPAEAVKRGTAYLEAGAPVVFVPGAVARGEIAALVDALGPRKLTLISVPGASLPARELPELGVARVSTGPCTQRVALTARQDATAAIVAGGTLPADTCALN